MTKFDRWEGSLADFLRQSGTFLYLHLRQYNPRFITHSQVNNNNNNRN
jgi:hypothetical protein